MASNSKEIRIYSNSESVSHQPSNGDMYWLWEQNPYESECFLDLDRKQFEVEMRKSVGLRKMFEMGILSVKESAVLEKFKLEGVDEYIMDRKKLENFIDESNVSDFEDFLQFAPQAMIDSVETICTSKELTDRNKIKLFKKYTGKDLEEFYDDKADVGEEVPKAEAKKGRQPRKPVIK
jgi:hypothetical protein